MSVNINLISSTGLEDTKNIRLRKIKTFSFVLLFFVGFLSLIVFLINYRFSVNYVRKQQQDLINKISIYDDSALKVMLLNSRLGQISTLLDKRAKYNTIVAEILKEKDPLVKIDEFEINRAGITMEISSASLFPLSRFLNNLLKMDESRLISGVNLESLSSSSTDFTMKIKTY